MWTRQRKKSKLRFAILPVVGLALLGYFSFHSINGSLGLNSSERYQAQIDQLKLELASLEQVRQDYEKRTSLLRDGSLERDLIDEQARLTLGLIRSNEIVLLHSNN
ncbi:MAG: septum formation initiator family protein [Pseudomonadota bacterium]